MTPTDRAAEIIRNRVYDYGWEAGISDAVRDMATAGLLITPEIQAVLDAAVDYLVEDYTNDVLCDAIDAYLASRGPS